MGTQSAVAFIKYQSRRKGWGESSSLLKHMTVEEARREINKANSRLYRLRQGVFKGDTPASRTLERNLKKLGLELTKKGFISTKGLKSSQILGAGRQAQLFSSYKTATTRGAKSDIATRTGTWQAKARDLVDAEFTPDVAQRIWKIFDTQYYKRLKETYGSDAVVAMAIRKLDENPDIDIKNWLYRREKAYRDGKLTEEQLLFETGGRLKTVDPDSDEVDYLLEEFD